ncbi:hypothetical protein XAPC_1481 [Xanthomonas citri pv. punicae str. LMG 859]|nr:hypothetical protein XAPC_1481 [Xanthomonas citri pv. punicae str. LMG 859]
MNAGSGAETSGLGRRYVSASDGREWIAAAAVARCGPGTGYACARPFAPSL